MTRETRCLHVDAPVDGAGRGDELGAQGPALILDNDRDIADFDRRLLRGVAGESAGAEEGYGKSGSGDHSFHGPLRFFFSVGLVNPNSNLNVSALLHPPWHPSVLKITVSKKRGPWERGPLVSAAQTRGSGEELPWEHLNRAKQGAGKYRSGLREGAGWKPGQPFPGSFFRLRAAVGQSQN